MVEEHIEVQLLVAVGAMQIRNQVSDCTQHSTHRVLFILRYLGLMLQIEHRGVGSHFITYARLIFRPKLADSLLAKFLSGPCSLEVSVEQWGVEPLSWALKSFLLGLCSNLFKFE